jgi:hypothetical protein
LQLIDFIPVGGLLRKSHERLSLSNSPDGWVKKEAEWSNEKAAVEAIFNKT